MKWREKQLFKLNQKKRQPSDMARSNPTLHIQMMKHTVSLKHISMHNQRFNARVAWSMQSYPIKRPSKRTHGIHASKTLATYRCRSYNSGHLLRRLTRRRRHKKFQNLTKPIPFEPSLHEESKYDLNSS